VLFLAGVGLQVLLSLLNKWVNWGIYAYSETQELLDGKRYRACEWISRQMWIDLLLDVGAVACFGIATWRIVRLFT
jgi:hypothetical protein